MKKIILITTLSFFCFHSFAQQDSILKNFKFRINNYRVITLGANQSAIYSRSKYPLYNLESSGVGGNVQTTLSTIRSTDKLQLNLFTEAGGGINTVKNSPFSGNEKNTSSSIYGSVSVLSRWFNKTHFWEAGADIYGITNNSKLKYNPSSQIQKYTASNYAITLYTGLGIGRLENITDMQNALWLNKELVASSSLSRELTPEELNKLGRSITKGNNTRILDSRRKTKYILQTVDNYLQSKGLVNKTDINYFTNLNDILFFALNDPRLSGTEKFIRVSPGLWSTDYTNRLFPPENKSTSKPTSKTVLVTIGFKTFKPLNLTHQNNYGAAIKFNYVDYESISRNYTGGVIQSEIKEKATVKKAGVNLFFTHAIYPNTRTIIRFTAETEMGWQDDKVSNENFYERSLVAASLNYFISYQTRFFVSLGVSHNKNFYTNSTQIFELIPNNFRTTLDTGLTINL